MDLSRNEVLMILLMHYECEHIVIMIKLQPTLEKGVNKLQSNRKHVVQSAGG